MHLSKKYLLLVLLLISITSNGQEQTPPAIQALKNAGITTFYIGNGKWQTNVNKKLKY